MDKVMKRTNCIAEWTNDYLVTYIETNVFDSTDNKVIIKYFQKMDTRHGRQL